MSSAETDVKDKDKDKDEKVDSSPKSENGKDIRKDQTTDSAKSEAKEESKELSEVKVVQKKFQELLSMLEEKSGASESVHGENLSQIQRVFATYRNLLDNVEAKITSQYESFYQHKQGELFKSLSLVKEKLDEIERVEAHFDPSVAKELQKKLKEKKDSEEEEKKSQAVDNKMEESKGEDSKSDEEEKKKSDDDLDKSKAAEEKEEVEEEGEPNFVDDTTAMDHLSNLDKEFESKLKDIPKKLTKLKPTTINLADFEQKPGIAIQNKVQNTISETFKSQEFYTFKPPAAGSGKGLSGRNAIAGVKKHEMKLDHDNCIHYFCPHSKQLHLYNLGNQKWYIVTLDIKFDIFDSFKSVMTKYDKIFLVGDYNKKDVWEFPLDIADNKALIPRTPMKHIHFSHALVYLDDHIYVMGGHGSPKYKKCEKYIISEDRWEDMAELNIGRKYHTACLFEERYIYVFGGMTLGETYISDFREIIERFDIFENSWELIKISSTNPYTGSSFSGTLQVADNKIIIFGGYLNRNKDFVDTIFWYNTDTNLITKNNKATLKIPGNFKCGSNPVYYEDSVKGDVIFYVDYDRNLHMYDTKKHKFDIKKSTAVLKRK